MGLSFGYGEVETTKTTTAKQHRLALLRGLASTPHPALRATLSQGRGVKKKQKKKQHPPAVLGALKEKEEARGSP
jgi:hypothetical protein